MQLLLGLGSNLGDRRQNLYNAYERIDFLQNKIISTIIETPALLPKNAFVSWDMPHLNAVITGECDLDPFMVLEKIKYIEIILGRDQNAKRWAPRIIDIDILLYGDFKINHPDLTIPHAEFFNRDFALIPAKEIAKDFVEHAQKKY